MRVIGDIVRLGAKRHARREAVVMGDRRVTYGQLDDGSDRAARGLHAAGVRVGDRVAILAENCVEFLEVAFAVAKAGAILVPLNFRYGSQELDYVLRDISPVAVFGGPGYEQALSAAVARTAITAPVYSLEGTGRDTLAGLRESGGDEGELPPVDPASTATILYTSGTTGNPKGVVATHDATIRLLPLYGIEGGLRDDDIMLVCMPLFHGGGLVIQALSALYFGASLVLFGKGFEPAKVLETVDREGVTITLWSPTMLAMLAGSGLAGSDSVRTIWYGSSSITDRVFTASRAMFPAAAFCQWYGTTEAMTMAVLQPADHDAHPGATGREILTADVRVVDEAGQQVGVGGIGEVVVASTGSVMVGYYGNDQATAAAMHDGWLHTGDYAEVHEDGFFTIIGRGSDLIITGGENVYPREIEDVLIDEPHVQDVAVFGVPDDVYGHRVTAAVVVNGAIDAERLREFVGTRIARYKVPREIHFVDQLPRNASGKVLRGRLADSFGSAGEDLER